ncbi:hypothetical protein ICN84_05310 [Akkermansia glycaniphila]|uniref:hypothetical protein n=1 Tax=Akkermansia glycaniphila TaxID=1679444 RepID=UPI001C0188F2|nr:hypothetical protein [Akkermansia glycaniphila]MBT9449493.1 hypothetical protein [Akkermansia glycaniphila]
MTTQYINAIITVLLLTSCSQVTKNSTEFSNSTNFHTSLFTRYDKTTPSQEEIQAERAYKSLTSQQKSALAQRIIKIYTKDAQCQHIPSDYPAWFTQTYKQLKEKTSDTKLRILLRDPWFEYEMYRRVPELVIESYIKENRKNQMAWNLIDHFCDWSDGSEGWISDSVLSALKKAGVPAHQYNM